MKRTFAQRKNGNATSYTENSKTFLAPYNQRWRKNTSTYS